MLNFHSRIKFFALGIPIAFLSMDLSFFFICSAFKQCFLLITWTRTFWSFFPGWQQTSFSFKVIMTSIAFSISTTFSSSSFSLTDWGIPEISALFLRLYWFTLLFWISKSIILLSKTFTLVLRRLFSSLRFFIVMSFRLITSPFELVIFYIKLDSVLERADRMSGRSALIASLRLVWYSWLPMSEIVIIWFRNSVVVWK